MAVDGTTITTAQIERVRDHTTSSYLLTKCAQALDPNSDTATRNKARTIVASAYNIMFPDPDVVFTATTTWTCPSVAVDGFDLFSVSAECFGAGAGGGNSLLGLNLVGGGGGGAGAYARKNDIPVTPGATYTVHVDPGGSTATDAGDTWFLTSATVMARGGSHGANAALPLTSGAGGTGGSAGSSIGDEVYAGGPGSAGTLTTAGAGGGAAGETGAGGAAAGTTAGTGNVFGGGDGNAAGPGGIPGGGGSGATTLLGAGQVGGRGSVQLYY